MSHLLDVLVLILGSVGRDYEFFYDPNDFYNEKRVFGKVINLPLSNPFRLQQHIFFRLGMPREFLKINIKVNKCKSCIRIEEQSFFTSFSTFMNLQQAFSL